MFVVIVMLAVVEQPLAVFVTRTAYTPLALIVWLALLPLKGLDHTIVFAEASKFAKTLILVCVQVSSVVFAGVVVSVMTGKSLLAVTVTLAVCVQPFALLVTVTV